MPVSISSPKITFLNLLRDNWNAAATSGLTPAFHTGHVNPNGDQRQVCFPTTQETSSQESGYDSISPDGPVSRRIGSVPCLIFARRSPTETGGVNPKLFIEQARAEVERIVHANVISLADLEYIGVSASVELPPDTEHEPPFFGWNVTIRYEWRKTPS